MNKRIDPANRREFLKLAGSSLLSTTILRSAAAMGIISQSIGCGGSSNASSVPANGGNGGAGAGSADPSPRPVDWPTGIGSGNSVVILGAGIAGMCAAFELKKLGYQVTLLEAKNRAGGRCQTIRAGDIIDEIDSQQICNFDTDPALYFNPGPARIPHHHDLIISYCRHFNIPLEPFINDNQAALFHAQNAFAGEPQIARQIVAETRGYIADLLAQNVLQGNLSVDLSQSEQTNLLAMLQQFGDLNSDYQYLNSQRSGFVGQRNSDSRLRGQPPLQHSLTELLRSNFWQFQLDFAQSLDQQTTMLQPVGGMDTIARAFEQVLLEDIVFEAKVIDIQNTSAGVSIVYEDLAGDPITLAGNYCICTIPATVLRQIKHNFSSEYRTAIEGFVYSQSVKTAFQSPRFWEQEHGIYGGISWTDQDITQIWYPSYGFGSAEGILIGAYTFGASAGQSLSDLQPAARLNQVALQASQIHGQIEFQSHNGVSVAWPKMPFQLGAWGVSSPGILTQGDDNVFFAGEHLSRLQGWQEGAVLSAYNAIDQIVSLDGG